MNIFDIFNDLTINKIEWQDDNDELNKNIVPYFNK